MFNLVKNIFGSNGPKDKPKPNQPNVDRVHRSSHVKPAEVVKEAQEMGNYNHDAAALSSKQQSTPIVFDGKAESFPAFWKNFRVVDKSGGISETRKLISLKAYLGSPALLEDITGLSYADAVKTLFTKYQYDPEAEYSRLFDELLKVKVSDDKYDAVRSVEKMEAILVQMGDLGEDMEDPALRTAYTCRLPARYQKQMDGSFAEFRKKIVALLKAEAEEHAAFLKAESKKAALLEAESKKKAAETESKKEATSCEAKPNNQPIINPISIQTTNEPDGGCVFCGKHPDSNDCTVISRCNQRLKFIESVKRCYRCLGSGHTPNNCRNSVKCEFCTKRSHHMALCWLNPRFAQASNQTKPAQKSPSNSTTSSGSSKENVAPLKSPVLTALYDQLRQIKLTEDRLLPSYDVYTKMEEVLSKMAAVNENMECAELRKLYLDRLPLWMHKKFCNDDTLEQIRKAVKREYDCCMKQRENEVKTHRKPKPTAKVAAISETKDDAVDSTKDDSAKLINGKPFPEPYGLCVFCHGHRYSYDCKTVITFDERMQILETYSKCHRCLGNHKQEDCKDVLPCGFCRKRSHHVSVCRLNPAVKLGKKKAPLTDTAKPLPTVPSDNSIKPSCVFCSGNHLPADCTVNRDYENRMSICTARGLCFICLKNHRANDCTDTSTCHHCQRYHHSALCWKSPNIDKSTVKANHFPSKSDSPEIADKPPAPFDTMSVTSNSAGSTERCIFCGKHEYSASCPNVSDLQQRYTVVERMRLCTICLYQHSGRDRRCEKKSCRYCNGKHSGALCSENPTIKPKSTFPDIIDKASIPFDTMSVTSSCTDAERCIFCGTHDYSSNCPVVTDIHQRYTIVERMERCKVCLYRHSENDRRCKKKPCRYCQNYTHNAALCSKNPTIKPSEIIVKEVKKAPTAPTVQPSQRSAKTPSPTNSVRDKPPRLCIFCRNHPFDVECHVVINYAKRQRIAEDNKYCRICLEQHVPYECQNRRPCTICRLMSHHPYLCPDNPGTIRTSSRVADLENVIFHDPRDTSHSQKNYAPTSYAPTPEYRNHDENIGRSDYRDDRNDGYGPPPYGHAAFNDYRTGRFAPTLLTSEQLVRDSSATIAATNNRPPSLLTMPTVKPTNYRIPPQY